MRKTRKRALTPDQIAVRASRGEDVSGYFTNKFTVVRPVLDHSLKRERSPKNAG